LKSLTKSTSSDSIWALATWLLIINVFFFDYGSQYVPSTISSHSSKPTELSPSLTTNDLHTKPSQPSAYTDLSPHPNPSTIDATSAHPETANTTTSQIPPKIISLPTSTYPSSLSTNY